MQSTGHSSIHALSLTSTQGSAITYVISVGVYRATTVAIGKSEELVFRIGYDFPSPLSRSKLRDFLRSSTAQDRSLTAGPWLWQLRDSIENRSGH